MADDIQSGMRQLPLSVDRVSAVLSRAEAELRHENLPEAVRRRVDQAFDALQSVCAAYGKTGGA